MNDRRRIRAPPVVFHAGLLVGQYGVNNKAIMQK